MFRTFLIASALLGVLTMTSPADARTIFQVKGGAGDASFSDRCPANQFMIGVAGNVGLWIDSIQIICAPILPNGTHGTSYYGPLHGGKGGGQQEFSCNSDAFVSEIAVDYWADHPKIYSVSMVCRTMTGDMNGVLFGTAPPSTFMVRNIPDEDQHCSSEDLASGLAGHYGKAVNALGLFCDARVVSGSMPSALPIRTTGQVKPTSAPGPGLCAQGLVWREASPTDHVCVNFGQYYQTKQQNKAAASHVSTTDQTYGSNACAQGYVWRAAFSGDTVCVTPQQRDEAAAENQYDATHPSH